MSNVSSARKVVHKPGHGFRVNRIPGPYDVDWRGRTRPTALHKQDASLPFITLREVTMLSFLNAVTDKPEWRTKVVDETIVAKWKEEALAPSSNADVPDTARMTERMFAYCIAELRHLASRTPADAPIRALPADVVKSDCAVSDDIKLRLQSAVRVLENVPADQKDWHPGSDGMVLDLVHPSLYPLMYGVSRVLRTGANVTSLEDCIKRCGEGEKLPEVAETWPSSNFSNEDAYSAKFQWLPCDVDISGEKAKIITYINNLHPKRHAELYSIIEEIIDASIPLWDITLAPFAPENDKSLFASFPLGNDNAIFPRRIEYEEATVDDNNQVELPEPPARFAPLPEPAVVSLKDTYGQKRIPLQIIVKLANIQLTPEKPRYEGGTWHVEGKANESICATAIYYYDCKNIKSSSLAFRQLTGGDTIETISYQQDEHDWLPAVLGLENDGSLVQNLGSVQTKEGRLITFPNILQHQVQPFELEDPTKPGHRKILALFLVDPARNIISTADVPCQQLDWWKEEVLKGTVRRLGDLPLELKDEVFSGVDDFPVSLDRAKEIREALMEERKSFVLEQNRGFEQEYAISLCEH